MKDESIRKGINIIIDALYNSDIDQLDKLELIFNLNHFLENYHNAIKNNVRSDIDERQSYSNAKRVWL